MNQSIKNRPKWYINPTRIRARTNHSWTGPELNKVYHLRMNGKSIPDIMKALSINIKKTQMYNMIRILKKKYTNKCFQCGQILTTEDLAIQLDNRFKRCSKCKKENDNFKQSKRKEYIEKGLCGYCGKFPIRNVEGAVSCSRCVSYVHRHRILKGFCGSCGKNPINKMRSIALCNVCLDRNVRYARKQRKLERKEMT